jgi:hypothetical protein
MTLEGNLISSGSVTDMDVDEIPAEEKGKAVVGRDNLELDGKASFALARAAFILKLLTEIVLMYPSAVNVILRRDAESSHLEVLYKEGQWHGPQWTFIPCSSQASSIFWDALKRKAGR